MNVRLPLALALLGVLGACATRSEPAAEEAVVRSLPPQHYESAITNFINARARPGEGRREVAIGQPQRGNCPMGASHGGYVGWVVPVEQRTRSANSGVVTVTSSYFWFSDEVIRGVTRHMELCP